MNIEVIRSPTSNHYLEFLAILVSLEELAATGVACA